MKVIPAIDIMMGEAVQLVEGKLESARRFGDPLIWASKFISEGAERLHLIDLDRAFDREGRGHKSAITLAREIRTNYPGIVVQVGGGLRTTLDVGEAVSAGGYAIVGTRAIRDYAWLREITRIWQEKVIVAVDARAGVVQTHAWTKESGISVDEFARVIKEIGVRTVLYTQVELDGRLEGLDPRRVRQVKDTFSGEEIIWAGGISSLTDIQVLQNEGISGCVLGSCLYLNKIRLKDALDIVRGREQPSREG